MLYVFWILIFLGALTFCLSIYHYFIVRYTIRQAKSAYDTPICFIDHSGVIVEVNSTFTDIFLKNIPNHNIPFTDCCNIPDTQESNHVICQDSTGRKWQLRDVNIFDKTMIIFVPDNEKLSWLHQLPLPCCLIDSHSRIHHINQHMTNYLDESWQTQPVDKYIHQNRLRDFQLCMKRANDSISFMDTLWKNKPIKLSIEKTYNDLYCVCIHDMQDIETIKQKAYVAQNLQLLGQLTASVTHDFNNVINAISLLLYSLQEKIKTGEETQQDIQDIQNTTARAQELIRQLLEFSKDKADSHENDPVIVLKNFMHSLVVLAGENVQLHIDIDAPQHLVQLSPAQILQIALNLIVNARDAKATNISLKLRQETLLKPKQIHTGMLAPRDYTVLTVTDNGAGIKAKDIGNVCGAFFSTKKTGSGLGLATIHRLATMHSGGIDLTSQPGETIFTIYIPCIAQNDTVKEKLAEQNGQYNIVLVEDDETIRDLMTRALKHNGYQVAAFENGAHALENMSILENTSLIITDFFMPKMDGVQFIQNVKQTIKHTPIILMSGVYPDELKGKVSEDVTILSKPVQLQQVLLTISNLLEAPSKE